MSLTSTSMDSRIAAAAGSDAEVRLSQHTVPDEEVRRVGVAAARVARAAREKSLDCMFEKIGRLLLCEVKNPG